MNSLYGLYQKQKHAPQTLSFWSLSRVSLWFFHSFVFPVKLVFLLFILLPVGLLLVGWGQWNLGARHSTVQSQSEDALGTKERAKRETPAEIWQHDSERRGLSDSFQLASWQLERAECGRRSLETQVNEPSRLGCCTFQNCAPWWSENNTKEKENLLHSFAFVRLFVRCCFCYYYFSCFHIPGPIPSLLVDEARVRIVAPLLEKTGDESGIERKAQPRQARRRTFVETLLSWPPNASCVHECEGVINKWCRIISVKNGKRRVKSKSVGTFWKGKLNSLVLTKKEATSDGGNCKPSPVHLSRDFFWRIAFLRSFTLSFSTHW